jgi:hypothetical protein
VSFEAQDWHRHSCTAPLSGREKHFKYGTLNDSVLKIDNVCRSNLITNQHGRGCEKERASGKKLPYVRPSFHLEEKMGSLLGGGSLLFGALPAHQKLSPKKGR